MEDELATLIQRLEAFQVALLEAAVAAADLEELLAAAADADAAGAAETALPPSWKVDGTQVQTAPGEPWINIYDAIKSVLEPRDQLEVSTDTHVEPCTKDSA